MQRRVIRRAATVALTVLVLATAGAQADTVPADGDARTAGNQTTIDLGEASPGELVTWPVRFRLTCAGLSHAAVASTIDIDYEGDQSPTGSSATATSTTIGPVPAGWPGQGEGCSSPAQSLASNGVSIVSLVMPPTPGIDQEFTVQWSRSGEGLTSMTVVTFVIDVIGNTPPTLHLPADQTAEATSAAGATVTWTATATDDEDVTPPTPTCTPASGSTFALGTTTVTCDVTDGGRMTRSGTFDVTVVDTTAPALAQIADFEIVTADPSGAPLDYGVTYLERVDPSPTVACSPTSGPIIPVGTTTVTCTARDASGNESVSSFRVTVRYVPSVAWTASWGEPLSGGTFVGNPGRTIPIKVELFANGVEQTRGTARLTVASCAGGPTLHTVRLDWDGNRWTGHLDTSRLGGAGCFVATARLDGQNVAGVRLELRGDQTATSAAPKGKAADKGAGKGG